MFTRLHQCFVLLRKCHRCTPNDSSIRGRYHTLAVPLTLSALASVPGQPLLTTLPGTFVVLSPRLLLSPAEAVGLRPPASAALQGGVGGIAVEGQLNGASIILGNIQVGAHLRWLGGNGCSACQQLVARPCPCVV